MMPVDQGEFFKLAMAEFDSVRRLARYLAAKPQDVEDLVQDTFLRAFRSAGTFQPRPGGTGIRPWLYRILNNVLKDRLSAEQRRSQLSEVLRGHIDDHRTTDRGADGEWSDSSGLADLSELNWDCVDERLKAAIGELTHTLRTPFLLYAAGLQYREIAQVIEVPLGTVMSRLYRARQLLSTRLASLAADSGLPRARVNAKATAFASSGSAAQSAAS